MDKTYITEEKQIRGEIFNAEHQKEYGLKKLGEKARQLATHLLKTPQATPIASSMPRVQAGRPGRETPGQRIMAHLQENFQFETRLTETKQTLKELSKAVDRTPPAFATSSLLRDVLREEIMPNLHMKVPQLARSVPGSSRAVVTAPAADPAKKSVPGSSHARRFSAIAQGRSERGIDIPGPSTLGDGSQRQPQFRLATGGEAAKAKPQGWALKGLKGSAALSTVQAPQHRLQDSAGRNGPQPHDELR